MRPERFRPLWIGYAQFVCSLRISSQFQRRQDAGRDDLSVFTVSVSNVLYELPPILGQIVQQQRQKGWMPHGNEPQLTFSQQAKQSNVSKDLYVVQEAQLIGHCHNCARKLLTRAAEIRRVRVKANR